MDLIEVINEELQIAKKGEQGMLPETLLLAKEEILKLRKAISTCAALDEVRKIANDVLYFDDNSDYGTALWQILNKVAPELFDEDGDIINDLEYSGD